MLAPENYERFRGRTAVMRNSAVYEIPELLAGILSNRPSQGDPASRQFTHYAGLSN
jgi:hypothetical protein